jgi:hypothetical protein
MQRFTDLKVWQRSHALVLRIYLTMLARDLGYVTEQVAQPLLDEIEEISRMLWGLRNKVEHADA